MKRFIFSVMMVLMAYSCVMGQTILPFVQDGKVWVYENLTPPYTPVPAVPPYIEYSYSSPIISMIGLRSDLVTRRDGFYSISDPLMDLWLKRALFHKS